MRFAFLRHLLTPALCFALTVTASAQSQQKDRHEGHDGHEAIQELSVADSHDLTLGVASAGDVLRDSASPLALRGLRALRGDPPEQTPSGAQQTARTTPSREPIGIRGFGLFGVNYFSAEESFEAVLGSRSGAIFGGGVQVVFPIGVYAEVGAWRFSGDGERVFVGPGDEVFPLGIPTTVKVTPLEITGGWRFGNLSRRVVPYAGAGVNWTRYEETADFADGDDNVDERFTGFQLVGGVEVHLHRWIHASGEIAWSSVADALGSGGASAAFDEDNLGGTSIRFKVLIGR